MLRPQLPPAERLLPYLRRIDDHRLYTNWGPLSAELEQRLCERLQLPSGGVSSAGSGTAAIVGAILATAGRAQQDRPLALVPAFTFVATAVAVEQCGYGLCLGDVDQGTWMLDPADVGRHPALDRVGVVVVVAPFGRPVPQQPWCEFVESTGIPVVIDGAASFDLVDGDAGGFLGDVPVAMSFHATKSFATGEGGCIASSDRELVLRAGQALNFGFHMTRESRVASINGKMSEYHAAVGLAELDGWDDKLSALRSVAGLYQRVLGEREVADRLHIAPGVGASYVLFECRDRAETARVEASLAAASVDSRRWYGDGVHRHEHFRPAESGSLAVTEDVARRLLGLPLAPDLSPEAVARVADALERAVR